MRRFWDRRAREDPAFFVDDRLRYGAQELDRIWAAGEEVLARFESELGIEIGVEDRVVEIGCGIGRLTRALARRADAVVALDVSALMLERARELNRDLTNVTWVLGDGVSLAGVDDASADACFSHVVFQHIPDPAITLGYVRGIGRVLRPGGWAAFQVSNDPALHRRRLRRGIGELLRAAVGRGPRGVTSGYWRGSAVDLDELRGAIAAGGMEIERLVREGTQFCLVRTRRG